MLSFGGCGNPGKSSDDAVATNSKAKLYSEQLLKSASVDVTAKDAIVTLSGPGPDNAARCHANSFRFPSTISQVASRSVHVSWAPLPGKSQRVRVPTSLPFWAHFAYFSFDPNNLLVQAQHWFELRLVPPNSLSEGFGFTQNRQEDWYC